MAHDPTDSDWREELRRALGYLNYSSGVADPNFLRGLNQIVAAWVDEASPHPWETLRSGLQDAIRELEQSDEAFRRADQARAVVDLVFRDVLPSYLAFHQDLLHHHNERSLSQPYFIGRVVEAVLRQGGPWDEVERIRTGALRWLNDYLGYRPVATLENERKLEPYDHERVRAIPVYVAGAGVAHGPFRLMLEQTLSILRQTSPDLLRQAWFDLDRLDELAIDPRAYDFDHPVNRRPNHHFGFWDPDEISGDGYYRRFIIHQVTLDGLLDRIQSSPAVLRECRCFESAAVLAGTMLMGSGVSGDRPGAHDSQTTLATLMPIIAEYRDRFYEELLARAPEAWRARLQAEAEERRQPFGGVRQDLNQYLATQRANQLARVSLAKLFAQMGYPDAAMAQAEAVAVASTRLRCQMDCRITRAHQEIDRGNLQVASALLPEIDDLLQRAIACGAVVDPWNILGFGAQFSLFPAVENTVHDHRVDELIDLMNDIFNLYARLEKAAAATGETALEDAHADRLAKLASWWDQFASTEVSGIEGFSGEAAWKSTAMVAKALRAWHQAGTAAGDVRFWSSHVEQFTSPKAFALVVDALLEQRDPVASMALLMRWLSESQTIPLSEAHYSFHALAVRWMADLWQMNQDDKPPRPSPVPESDRWPLSCKFLDFLEANAGEYWKIPSFELEIEEDEDDERDERKPPMPTGVDDLFRAAYEHVTYRDSTDDGIDAEMSEGAGGPRFDDEDDFELADETDRISDLLAFQITLAKLWKFGSLNTGESSPAHDETRRAWLTLALDNWEQLLQLLRDVDRYRVAPPRGTTEALLEYDRHRGTKEILLDRIIWTCVEVADAVQLIQATLDDVGALCELADWEGPVSRVFRAAFHGDTATIRAIWPGLLAALAEETLLYVPTSRGGDPHRIVASRCLQQILARLLEYLPKLGLLTETFQLLETVHRMEQDHPVGPGAITEFDRLFEIGSKGIIECLVDSSEDWKVRKAAGRSKERQADLALIECVEQATEELLRCWLAHSRGIRISVLESVSEIRAWNEVKNFVERFGADLFTQHFMNFGNLRAILHEGVDTFLDSLMEMPDPEMGQQLVTALKDQKIDPDDAVNWLELVLEAVAENYSEYIDYNSTTTQSDRGELLYTFLDFLRLQASYDRVAWNLKPVFLAHEVMTRKRRDRAAALWQTAVARRSTEVADNHIRMYEQLSQRYGMWLPCVRERLRERFIRPLEIDRMCAWVRPAIDEAGAGAAAPHGAFQQLYEAVEEFLSEPSSVGFEVPSWLESLQNEVFLVRNRPLEDQEPFDPTPQIEQVRLSQTEVFRQIEEW